MKIIDTTTFYKENMMLELRFNMLDQYVDYFVICESKYSHSGNKKRLFFDYKKFKKFKKKIIYLVVENEPDEIVFRKDNHVLNERINSIVRISHQRDFIRNALQNFSSNDFVLHSDNDEIPNLSNLNFQKLNEKILIFKQKLFYFKFNLLLDRIYWYGTRGLRKKDLSSFQDLREIKPKKYPFYRIDTFFKKNKFIDLRIIKNGGWHFTRIISPEEIHERELDTEHSDEYIKSGKDVEKIKDLIKRRVIDHDHLADKKDYKFGKEFNLKLFPTELLPLYIQENMAKYKDHLDYD